MDRETKVREEKDTWREDIRKKPRRSMKHWTKDRGGRSGHKWGRETTVKRENSQEKGMHVKVLLFIYHSSTLNPPTIIQSGMFFTVYIH